MHKVLACVAGAASIGFGGEQAEGAIVVEMKLGDVAIVPAGVGQRRLNGTPDFKVAGAYPPGQNGTISWAGSIDVEEARRRIAALADPSTGPVSGHQFEWTRQPI